MHASSDAVSKPESFAREKMLPLLAAARRKSHQQSEHADNPIKWEQRSRQAHGIPFSWAGSQNQTKEETQLVRRAFAQADHQAEVGGRFRAEFLGSREETCDRGAHGFYLAIVFKFLVQDFGKIGFQQPVRE